MCWGAGHPPNGLALDLRLEADAGPSYVTEALTEPLDVLGVPEAVLDVAATQPVAHLVVRLGCVAPDGSIEQVSEGLLNLTHRDSDTAPSALEPGRRYEVRVPLRAAGYRFPAGSRIHLSLASSHWPVVWPSPGAGELSIHRGPGTASRLELPLAPAAGASVDPPPFDEQPVSIREFGKSTVEPSRWEMIDDPDAGTVTIRTFEAETNTLPDGVTTLYVDEALEMVATDREPGHGRFENACEYRLDRDRRQIVIVADGTTVASETTLDMFVRLRIELDGRPFFDRSWREEIPRLLA